MSAFRAWDSGFRDQASSAWGLPSGCTWCGVQGSGLGIQGSGIRVQLLHRNVQRFRGGLVFKAHRLSYLRRIGAASSASGLSSGCTCESTGCVSLITMCQPHNHASSGALRALSVVRGLRTERGFL